MDDSESSGLPVWARAGAPGRPLSEPFANADPEVPASGSTLPLGEMPTPHTRTRKTVGGLAWLYRYVVVGGLCLAGASALRLLDDWDEGAYWVADVVLVSVAAICGVLGVIVGVSTVGAAQRYRSVARGRGLAVVGLLLAIALSVGAGLRAVDDWYDLDVPDAYDRLELGNDDDLVDQIDAARDAAEVADQRNVDANGAATVPTGPPVMPVPGACFEGPVWDPRGEVACEDPHQTELYLRWTPSGDGGLPDGVSQEEVDRGVCTSAPGVPDQLPEGIEVAVITPDSVAWVADGMNRCALVSESPTEGEIIPS